VLSEEEGRALKWRRECGSDPVRMNPYVKQKGLYRSQALAYPLLFKAYLAQVDNDGKTEEAESSSGVYVNI